MYSLEAPAFDGNAYSEIVKVDFTVDHQKAQGKGFIPGFSGLVALLALVAVAVPLLWSKRALSTRRGGPPCHWQNRGITHPLDNVK